MIVVIYYFRTALENEYCSAYGFAVCEGEDAQMAMNCQNNVKCSSELYRTGSKIPRKPKIYDSPRKKMLRKHINRLNQNVRRMSKKISNLKVLVKLLKKKNLVGEEHCNQIK